MTARDVLVSGVMGPLAPQAAALLAQRGYEPVALDAICSADLDRGLACVDNDVCVFAIGLIGQYVRYLREHGSQQTAVLAPELCKDCRSMNLPQLVHAALERAGLAQVEVLEFNHADVSVSCPAPPAELAAAGKKRIGVCGNVPVLTTTHFHKTVTEHLRREGFDAVMPPLGFLVHSADFMTPAIEYFAQNGVSTVICILAFGCLGGHVYARGQARKLQREFPGVELTILDYDPSASDINTINRVELVLQSMR